MLLIIFQVKLCRGKVFEFLKYGIFQQYHMKQLAMNRSLTDLLPLIRN